VEAELTILVTIPLAVRLSIVFVLGTGYVQLPQQGSTLSF
jgi:hypothetical protein